MTDLYFRPYLGDNPLTGVVDLPVEVRKPNLAIVAETVTSQRLRVGPGTYLVSARLPTGQQLYNTITVAESQASLDVELHPDPNEDLPSASAAPPVAPPGGISFGTEEPAPRDIDERPREQLWEPGAEPVLRLFRGNLLQGPVAPAGLANHIDPLPDAPLGQAVFEVHVKPPALIQLLQAGASPLNLLLPAKEYERCVLILTQQPDGRVDPALELDNPTANSLLNYTARGFFVQADALTSNNSPVLISEDLLYGKFMDPIAACVGAYTLLRLGDLERLHTWTGNLKEYFPWLPDGIVIRAEHLARLGQHAEAFKTLLELPARGLPFFSDGLSYAVNRLRTYIDLGKSDELFEGAPAAETLLARLRRFVPFTNFRRPILTFTGLDPAAPDDTPLGDHITTLEGLRVGPYFGRA